MGIRKIVILNNSTTSSNQISLNQNISSRSPHDALNSNVNKAIYIFQASISGKKKRITNPKIFKRGGLMKMAVSEISFLVAYFKFSPYIWK